jgi:putative endonuclease
MIGLIYRAADALRRRTLRDDPGRLGEDMAHRYLRSHGCTVVARNYRTRNGAGEIDIIAWEGETLVFVEVKTRTTAEFGEPDRAVDIDKRDHLRRAAREYGRRASVLAEASRFDVISIVLVAPVRIDWHRDAFR